MAGPAIYLNSYLSYLSTACLLRILHRKELASKQVGLSFLWSIHSQSVLNNKRGFFFLVWRDPEVSLKGRISRLPEQPC